MKDDIEKQFEKEKIKNCKKYVKEGFNSWRIKNSFLLGADWAKEWFFNKYPVLKECIDSEENNDHRSGY